MRDQTKELGNTAEASDEDEEGRALMIKPGTSTVKEEKENDAFFKKVKSCNLIQQSSRLFAFYNDLLSVSSYVVLQYFSLGLWMPSTGTVCCVNIKVLCQCDLASYKLKYCQVKTSSFSVCPIYILCENIG